MDALTIKSARALLTDAEALLVTAGAGMGVDSGLPDFRGNEGFWRAYPPYRRLGLSFVEMASPDGFLSDPGFAWGFYGHRLNLYRSTQPHAGFSRIRDFARTLRGGAFVFTSNVDGHFHRSGFAPQVLECHGSLNHLQCAGSCGEPIWSAESLRVVVDMETMRATPPLPSCPGCGGPARPNVLMFGDFDWDAERTERQERRYCEWLARWGGDRLVVLEFGAGSAVPTVRLQSERIAADGAALVRVNPREAQLGPRLAGAGLACGALEACELLFADFGAYG